MSNIAISSNPNPVTFETKQVGKPSEKDIFSLPEPKMTGDKLNLSNVAPKEEKSFGVKEVNVKFGYIANNDIVYTGPIHIQNDSHGTDLTISGAKQEQRGSWSYIDPSKVLTGQQRFAPDEPQFDVDVGVKFNNNFGIELDAKHNKVIMAGYDQTVHFEGMMNGQYVDMDAPLDTFMSQHEQTLGNIQLTIAPTYTVELFEKGKHNISLTTKLGPSLITSNTRSNFKNSDGEWESQTSKLQLVGYGGMLENEICYKYGRFGLAVGHSLSALNYSNYEYGAGGIGNHCAINSAVTVKATFDIFKK